MKLLLLTVVLFSSILARGEIERRVSIGVGEKNLFSSFLSQSITIQIDDDEIEVSSNGFSSNLLGEDIKYEDQIFINENIFYQILKNEDFEFMEDVWLDDFYLLDKQQVKVRFLFYEKPEESAQTKLYRFDVVSIDSIEKENIINDVILNSDVMKIWYDYKEKSLKKISLTFKGINYLIDFNDE